MQISLLAYKIRKTQENFSSWQQLHINLDSEDFSLVVLGQIFTPKVLLLCPFSVIFQPSTTKPHTLSVSLINLKVKPCI